MFITDCSDYDSDLMEVIRIYIQKFNNDDQQYNIVLSHDNNDNYIKSSITISFDDNKKSYEYNIKIDENLTEKKILKIALYRALSSFFGKSMPYGALTGIRPTKLAWDMYYNGKGFLDIKKFLKDVYSVSDEKIDLIFRVMATQKPYMIKNDKEIDFYVNIPFCTSRCSYCSFISAEISKCKDFLEDYVNTLIYEIREVKSIIKTNNYIVRNIYIGGGTPTSLPLDLLEKVLSELSYPINEFTVEAGRSDTITKEKLDLLKKYNVTRISINPQTFNDKVLKKVGRKTTSEETINCYKLARNYDFIINMDFIAGLDGETLKSFKNNIDIALQLKPDNITIHSLALKRASMNNHDNVNIFKNDTLATKMIKYSTSTIINKGYEPYYMYRQKNMLGGLENIGFTTKSNACKFNINSMEEIASCIACGANAISKKIYNEENRIERQANNKDIKTYMEKINEFIAKKQELFSK